MVAAQGTNGWGPENQWLVSRKSMVGVQEINGGDPGKRGLGPAVRQGGIGVERG